VTVSASGCARSEKHAPVLAIQDPNALKANKTSNTEQNSSHPTTVEQQLAALKKAVAAAEDREKLRVSADEAREKMELERNNAQIANHQRQIVMLRARNDEIIDAWNLGPGA